MVRKLESRYGLGEWVGVEDCAIVKFVIVVYGHLLDKGNLEICVKTMIGNVKRGTRNGAKDFGL